ncbi:unnamed protein product [Ilex paraguariensis]|uniref:Uncharacterized protein n=1 Tax=Ilex paraguariensis TaxID=185542 RepID=A0ABC8ST27_9AQUA
MNQSKIRAQNSFTEARTLVKSSKIQPHSPLDNNQSYGKKSNQQASSELPCFRLSEKLLAPSSESLDARMDMTCEEWSAVTCEELLLSSAISYADGCGCLFHCE